MRIIDGNTIETECDSCASTFTCSRGEDGEPDEILCSECKQTWQELRAELAKERDRVWLETFLSFPFKALPAPKTLWDEEDQQLLDELNREGLLCCECCDEFGHHIGDCPDLKAWREHQDLMDAADQAAYYSPRWEDNR